MTTVTGEALAALLVHQAPDAVIFAGTDGVIQLWNTAATEMFGFSEPEAIGKDLNIIIPEQFRDAHWKGYDRALEAGQTKYRGQSLPTRAVNARGEAFYVELSFAIVHGPDGEVIGALAHARNIHERFETDRANRRRMRELEEEIKALRGPGGARPA
ncbi:MAG: transcriptional regulator [Dehalococcoidia bacterium]|jgi:PAS domain S-box-containing protein|nr:PAS domain S-box protein [Tepidiformaceae bacterium]